MKHVACIRATFEIEFINAFDDEPNSINLADLAWDLFMADIGMDDAELTLLGGEVLTVDGEKVK